MCIQRSISYSFRNDFGVATKYFNDDIYSFHVFVVFRIMYRNISMTKMLVITQNTLSTIFKKTSIKTLFFSNCGCFLGVSYGVCFGTKTTIVVHLI